MIIFLFARFFSRYLPICAWLEGNKTIHKTTEEYEQNTCPVFGQLQMTTSNSLVENLPTFLENEQD